MKRVFTNDGSSAAPFASGPSNHPQKRSKTNQACKACKKNKTRCEVLGSESTGRDGHGCHRCNTLNIPCSFEVEVASHGGSRQAPSGSTHSPPASASSTALVSDLLASSASVDGFRTVPAGPDHNIERLPLPIPPNSTWNTLQSAGSVDWLDTPVYSIRTIARGITCATGNGSIDEVDTDLREILTPRQLDSLLERLATCSTYTSVDAEYLG